MKTAFDTQFVNDDTKKLIEQFISVYLKNNEGKMEILKKNLQKSQKKSKTTPKSASSSSSSSASTSPSVSPASPRSSLETQYEELFFKIRQQFPQNTTNLTDRHILRSMLALKFNEKKIDKQLKNFSSYLKKYDLVSLHGALASMEKEIKQEVWKVLKNDENSMELFSELSKNGNLQNFSLEEFSKKYGNFEGIVEKIKQFHDLTEEFLPLLDAKTLYHVPEGVDKQGNGPLVYLKAANWNAHLLHRKSTFRAHDLFLEQILMDNEPMNVGRGQCWIEDLKNVSTKQLDLVGEREYAHLVCSVLPVIPGRTFLINVPTILKTFIKAVNLFYNQTYRDSLIILDKPEQLKNYIDEQFIPEEYGGKMKHDYYDWLCETFFFSIKKNKETKEKVEEDASASTSTSTSSDASADEFPDIFKFFIKEWFFKLLDDWREKRDLEKNAKKKGKTVIGKEKEKENKK